MSARKALRLEKKNLAHAGSCSWRMERHRLGLLADVSSPARTACSRSRVSHSDAAPSVRILTLPADVTVWAATLPQSASDHPPSPHRRRFGQDHAPLQIRKSARERRRRHVFESDLQGTQRSGRRHHAFHSSRSLTLSRRSRIGVTKWKLKQDSSNSLAFFRFPGKLLQGRRCSTISTQAALHQNRAIGETIS